MSTDSYFPFVFEDGALNGINFHDVFNDEQSFAPVTSSIAPSSTTASLSLNVDLPSSDDCSNMVTPKNATVINAPSIFALDELDLNIHDGDLMQPIFDFGELGLVASSSHRSQTNSTTMKKKRARSQMSVISPEYSNKRVCVSSPSSNESCDTIIRGSWSLEEDNMLRALVSEMLNRIDSEGAISWTMIAAKMKIRSAKQCRERWILNLDPSINHEPFLPHEDAILLNACAQLGPRWTKIKTLLPGRTENSVKTRYKSLTRKSNLRSLSSLMQGDSSVHILGSR